ncbi:hypothetical protein ABEX78_21335 [Priestia megaterium]
MKINITLGLIIIFFAFSLFYTAINTRKRIPYAVNAFLFILILGICIWLHILNIWIAIGALITVAIIALNFKTTTKKQ